MRSSIFWNITSINKAAVFAAITFLIAGYLGQFAHADDSEELQVLSGDSLRIGKVTYCLKGIDAPEIGQTCKRANGKEFDCGHISKTALMDLTAGAKVKCTAETETGSCRIAKCDADGFDLSQNMVHTGWAVGINNRFANIQNMAKRRKHGLWKGTFELPSEWRARQK